MENTKNKLTLNESIFFDKLKKYIDKPIYFYGSIQRDDYFQVSDPIAVPLPMTHPVQRRAV